MDKPDAILLPATYAPKGDPNSFLVKLKEEFAPIFGCKRVSSCQVGKQRLVVPWPHSQVKQQALLHGDDHELAGQERYEWEDAGNGIQYGYLTSEARAAACLPGAPKVATANAPKASRQAAERLFTKLEEWKTRIAELDGKADRSEAETKELGDLKSLASMFEGISDAS